MNPVTVILQGGYALELDPTDTDPVIQSLISGEVFTSAPDRALEVPTAGGELLRFRAGAVVAVILPGAGAQPAGDVEETSGADAPKKSALVYGRAAPGAVEPYVLIENFLSAAEHDEILHRTLAAREHFVASKVDDDALHYRASLVLSDAGPIADLMRARIAAALPAAAVKLGLAKGPVHTEPSAVECQVTAHNHGDYYRVHNDAGSPRTKRRTLSYVYYFQSKPKSFQGGELRLYEVAVRGGFYEAGESYWLIEPKDNAVLFFPSHAMHEVLPVTCSSRAFEDSRFTVNGWVAL